MSRRYAYVVAGAAIVVSTLYLLGVPLQVMLSYAFILACPLMMFLMMGHMGGHMSHGSSAGHAAHQRELPPLNGEHERLP